MVKIVPMNVTQATYALGPAGICVTMAIGERAFFIVEVSLTKLQHEMITKANFLHSLTHPPTCTHLATTKLQCAQFS